MTDKRSSELWKIAIPLNRAWQHFAPADLRDAYASAFKPQEGAQQLHEGAGWLSKTLDVVGAVGSGLMAQKKAEEAMKANLAGRIADGELQALGYRTEPTRSRGPVIIGDPNFERRPPNWAEEFCEVRGEVFCDVRVAPAALRQSTAKRGRPGSADKILEAIAELVSETNSGFCDMPRPQACQRVRDALQKKGFDVSRKGAGVSDKNIEKLILRYCPKRQL